MPSVTLESRVEELGRGISIAKTRLSRFEFRFDASTGTLNFLEVNLQANLWSEKVFGRSAVRAGLTQAQLVETILYEGLRRHGLLATSNG